MLQKKIDDLNIIVQKMYTVEYANNIDLVEVLTCDKCTCGIVRLKEGTKKHKSINFTILKRRETV